ncbi:fumarylacetoacetate hydrolase family protein [Nocardia pseudovaccinii]|uniref:fumarylacetoacetate hydrolase family protein n=1 Tax=Nocardia pseudovaccinii TaxID=189540 RepID=UPI0007A4B0B9|nr:fumarylacetoacetate hydrolase family protein [Nocardia pseudovaccinii]
MKLVRVAASGTGFVVDSGGVASVVESTSLVGQFEGVLGDTVGRLFGSGTDSWMPLIAQWPSIRSALTDTVGKVQADLDQGFNRFGARPLDDVVLDPPLPDPGSRIFAAGGNFPAHAAGMASKTEQVASGAQSAPPWGFFVIPGTVVGHGAIVTPPDGTEKLDYEAEVAVVLGGGEHSPGSDQIAVWGYTAWNDFSIRDEALGLRQIDHGPLTWSLTKNFRTGNACGPWLVVDEGDVSDLRIRCLVNGRVRQDGKTSQMQNSFGRMAGHISRYVPIGGGDIILSGTPDGTAMEGGINGPFLQNGDEIGVLVDGISELRNVVRTPIRPAP